MISELILQKITSLFLKGKFLPLDLTKFCSYDNEEMMIQRFLEGNQWKFKEAYEQIIGHHKFLQTYPLQPSMYESFYQELNKGFCYVHRRDRSHRPIFVLEVGRLKKAKITPELALQMSTYFVQFLITRVLVPGKVENWVAIVNMKDVGITEVPKKLMKAITQPLQVLFKARLYRLHVINAQWTIKIVWSIVKKLVDPLTQKKFVVCEDDFSKDLFKLADPNSLEKRFGGNLDDKTGNYFPPDLI